jgi:hypothetical protein
MNEYRTGEVTAQALGAKLVRYVTPVLDELEQVLDVRLVRTALGLLQVMLVLRHNRYELLLSELGGTCWGRSRRRRGRSGSATCCGAGFGAMR